MRIFRSAASGAPLQDDYQFRGSRRRPRTGSRQESRDSFVNAQGDINAGSRKELVERLAGVIDDIIDGRINTSPSVLYEASAEEMEEQGRLVEAAIADRALDPNGPFAVMGETIGDSIWETTGRLGFARKFLFKMDVTRGQEGRFRIRQKNVVSWIITKDSYIPRTVVNQPWVYPEVVTIPTYVTISDNENATAPVEFMDEKFQDGLESTMVTEDKIVRYLFTQAAPVFNDVFTFTEMTPAIWSTMQTQIQRWGLQVPHCVMAIDLWTDIRTNTDFLAVLEPVTKLQLLEEGRIGGLYGTEIYTDGLRYDTLQVLNAGEIFFLANPIGLGGIADYEPLQTEPVSLHPQGISARGWFMWQSGGYVVGNSRAVCQGYRTS